MDLTGIEEQLKRNKERSEERKNYDRDLYAKHLEQYNTWLEEDFGYKRINEKMYDDCVKFCAYYRMDLTDRGLFLCAGGGNNIGTGKTFFMHCLSKFFQLDMFDIREIVKTYETSEERYQEIILPKRWPVGRMKGGDLVIDEIGVEEKSNIYGKREELFSQIVADRYNFFKTTGKFTHFTTNLTFEGIEKRYGQRTMSRLKEMCTFVNSEGIDLRGE